MYLEHFGMRAFPFRITPDPAFLYWTADHHSAFELLCVAVREGRPVTALVGEPGTGKTTLLQHFIARLPQGPRVGMISNYTSGLGGLDQWLHRAFELSSDCAHTDLRESFQDFLISLNQAGTRCLLIVDEAQNLSDGDIATLINLTRLPATREASMLLILAGQRTLRPKLPASLRNSDETTFDIAELRGMSEADTRSYIRHRLTLAGCDLPIFDERTTARIARLTGGLPRLVNVVCELLLTSAFGAGARQIDENLLDRVLQDAHETGMLAHLFGGNTAGGKLHIRHAPLPEPLADQVVSLSERTDGADLAATPAIRTPIPGAHSEQTETWRGAEGIAGRKPRTAPTRPQPMTQRESTAADPLDAPVPSQQPQNSPIENAEKLPRSSGRHVRSVATLVAVVAGVVVFAFGFSLLRQADSPEGSSLPSTARTENARSETVMSLPPAPIAPSRAVAAAPALLPPDSVTGSDPQSLHEQALSAGATDARAAAIGFARAALRGDDRAAYYLGQYFEAGDGLPQNTTLAAAWYAQAARSQRIAQRALDSLSRLSPDFPVAEGMLLPRVGLRSGSALGEFIGAAHETGGSGYLIEISTGTDAPAAAFGPFTVSAAIIDLSPEHRFWRVVSVDRAGDRLNVSGWHELGQSNS